MNDEPRETQAASSAATGSAATGCGSATFMTNDGEANAVFEVRLQRGMVMADTGCRRAV